MRGKHRTKTEYSRSTLAPKAINDVRCNWVPSKTTEFSRKYKRTKQQILDIAYGRTYQISPRQVPSKAIYVHWCEWNLT